MLDPVEEHLFEAHGNEGYSADQSVTTTKIVSSQHTSTNLMGSVLVRTEDLSLFTVPFWFVTYSFK